MKTRNWFQVTALMILMLALTVVSGAFADSGIDASPSGATVSGVVDMNGDPIDITALPAVCMTDSFGFRWQLDAVNQGGGVFNITGVVDALTGFNWNGSGTATVNAGVVTYDLRADNPQADGCASGFTDFFEYDGTGQDPRVVNFASGTWTSYCAGSPVGSGDWTATFAPGSCGINQ